jgi:hypothetical protein
MTFEEWWNKIVQERTGGNTKALDQDVYLRLRDMARQGWDAALESVKQDVVKQFGENNQLPS